MESPRLRKDHFVESDENDTGATEGRGANEQDQNVESGYKAPPVPILMSFDAVSMNGVHRYFNLLRETRYLSTQRFGSFRNKL
ncbi:hypothetical protein A2707_05530 [Candidatus Saccharibacteria bacterium RIFCSPHIGHO2_01_FULL_45_15]|nr:MAG: hypothetical protein A2707_05530 [Candidatus Saccharibacteria bacterium RIFCSPHIGHO2_01_FULL_45_15]OGL28907.1 MAG: hypothetical protein A3C39_05745 [Candidatus Saccharibacteria bacterium RIFCSPHIGHO2_02_FULL_46_12]OGL31920.1 MAG: hypothetical protein A3E76_01475 [Candidatus Saccharibacteria bacterium RIFCSPHIGHO2_12_FULL_44_22]